MKRFATVFVALGLATAGSSALAQQGMDQVNKQSSKPQPVKMTEAQMDNVAGGALVNVVAFDLIELRDVANGNNVQVAVPVTAAVGAAVGVLSGPQVAAAMAQQRGSLGRQFQ